MKVSEAIERLMALPQYRADDELVISLSEKSVGRRAHAHIAGFGGGIDYDKGVVFIKPTKHLITKYYDRDTPRAVIKDTVEGRKNPNVVRCPECWNIVRKTYRYCPDCGQRLKEE